MCFNSVPMNIRVFVLAVFNTDRYECRWTFEIAKVQKSILGQLYYYHYYYYCFLSPITRRITVVVVVISNTFRKAARSVNRASIIRYRR